MSKDLTPNPQNTEFSFKAKLGVCLKKHKKIIIKTVSAVVTAALWFLIWQIASMRVGIDFILPSPAAAFKKFFEILTR